MHRPNSSSADSELYQLLVRDLALHGAVTEIRTGVIHVEVPVDGAVASGTRRVEIRMTPAQLRETVTSLAQDAQEALGVADPVEAGWALFSIHLEEDLAMLRPTERHLLWHRGRLQPSVDLTWPPEPAES